MTSDSPLEALYASAPASVRQYVRMRAGLIDISYLRPYLPPSGQVLDLGCGYGLLANSLALEYPALQVLGYDFDARRIQVAQATVGERTNVRFVVGDALQSAQAADLVVMTDFLHHLTYANQEALLHKLHAQMRPGSHMIVLDVEHSFSIGTFMSWLSDMVLYPFIVKGKFRSVRDWLALFERTGFAATPFDRPTGIFAGIGFTCTRLDR